MNFRRSSIRIGNSAQGHSWSWTGQYGRRCDTSNSQIRRYDVWNGSFSELAERAKRAGTSGETGQWLKSVCRELGLTSDLAAVSVPRRELSFKLIDLPNVPDDELGPLVSLQVELRTQTSGQEVAWDALHHRVDSPEATTRQITLATLPASTRSAMETACRAAGHRGADIGDLLVGNQRTSDRGCL